MKNIVWTVVDGWSTQSCVVVASELTLVRGVLVVSMLVACWLCEIVLFCVKQPTIHIAFNWHGRGTRGRVAETHGNICCLTTMQFVFGWDIVRNMTTPVSFWNSSPISPTLNSMPSLTEQIMKTNSEMLSIWPKNKMQLASSSLLTLWLND